jgi:NAD(P)-dependent dehydrogenase (short-subunit alcohol dehydrogenase family)
VTSWSDLKNLFKEVQKASGRIDHVFANAGIGASANYLEEAFDDAGELKEPSQKTFEVNLRGAINTSYLGIHYMRHQDPPGGSIVVTASASSIQPFQVVDYATAKTGILGFIRGMKLSLETAGLPIRINTIGPSWTMTGLVPPEYTQGLGIVTQPPEVAARSALIFMADEKRNGGEYPWVEPYCLSQKLF